MKQKRLERAKKAENKSNENKATDNSKSEDKSTETTVSNSLPTPSTSTSLSNDKKAVSSGKPDSKTYHPLTPTTSPLSDSVNSPKNPIIKGELKVETRESKKRSLDTINNLMDEIQSKKIKPVYNDEMKSILNNISINDINNFKIEKIDETIDFLKDLNEQINITTAPNVISPICNYSPISNQEEIILNPQTVTTVPVYNNVTANPTTAATNTIQQPVFNNYEQIYDDVIAMNETNPNINGPPQTQQYTQFASTTASTVYTSVPATTVALNQPITINEIQPIPGQIIAGNDIQPIPAQIITTTSSNVPQQYYQMPSMTLQQSTLTTTTSSQQTVTTSTSNVSVPSNSSNNVYAVYVTVPGQTQPQNTMQAPVQTQPMTTQVPVILNETPQATSPIPNHINTNNQVQFNSIQSQSPNTFVNCPVINNVTEQNFQNIVYNRVYIEDENVVNQNNGAVMTDKINVTQGNGHYQNDNPYIFIRSTPGLNQYNNTSIAMLSPKMVPTTTLSQPLNTNNMMQQCPPQVTVPSNPHHTMNAPVASNNGKMPAVLLVQQPHITITNPSTNVVPMYTLAANMESNIDSELEIEVQKLKEKIKDKKKNSKSCEHKSSEDDIKLLEQRLTAFSLDSENNYSRQNDSSTSGEEMEDEMSEDEDVHLRPMNQKEQNFVKTTTTTASGSVITQMKPVGKSKGKQNAYANTSTYSSYKSSQPTVSYQEALFDVVDTDDLMADDVILNDDEILINNEEEKPTYTSFSASKSKEQNKFSNSSNTSSYCSSLSSSMASLSSPSQSTKTDKASKRSTIAMLPKNRYSIIQTDNPLINHTFNDADPETKKYINASIEPSPKPESNTKVFSPLIENQQKEYHHNLIEKMIEILNQKKSTN